MRAAAADLQKEYGDYQTPLGLAQRVVALLKRSGAHFGTIVEPTCGVGAFLQASAEAWGGSARYWGYDINDQYVLHARAALERQTSLEVTIEQRDFYTIDWEEFFAAQPEPILVVGNPPWVTNAGMGTIRGSNLPAKANDHKRVGLDAKTGKANFDISEWMLVRLLNALKGRQATIAVLCKTATARRVLRHAWDTGIRLQHSSLHSIDASLEFGVSVDACLLCVHTSKAGGDLVATNYPDLSFDSPLTTFGLVSGELISDITAYSMFRGLDGT